MTKITFDSSILAFAEAEYKNPYLRFVKFILADDKPNINKQAIPYEEFPGLAKSAVGMPIKMRFLGRRGGAGGHEASIPIGHIQHIIEDEQEDGTHRLIAEGVLYADEYPDQIEYLEAAFAAGEAPGISWEISYHEDVLDKGVQFLKGVIARAATFVKFPAYGKRTALLALASDASLSEEQLDQEIESLLKERQGGTNKVTLEEAQAKIAELEKELGIVQSELAGKASEIESLSASAERVEELETALAEKEATIAAYEKATLVAERTAKVVEAGLVLDTDAEKLAAKQELWAAMSEEIFEEFVSTVKAVAEKKSSAGTAQASATRLNLGIPKPTVDTGSAGSVSTTDLRSRMASLSRPERDAE